MSMPTIVVGGTESGVGKTSIALGLMRAFRDRGAVVQPFKVGPDFVDPLHHRRAAGRESYNLDGWMAGREGVRQTFRRATRGADVAVVEGVMGLFDGYAPDADVGSTAEVAATLEAPVVLVVDAWSKARSAAAVVQGFADFAPEVDLAGVVFNRVAGDGHLDLLREAVADAVDSPVFGGLPRDEDVAIPERHLGLDLPGRSEAYDTQIDRLGELVGEHLDLERLESLAETSLAVESSRGGEGDGRRETDVRLGVARDEAFCFYYRDNLDRLRELGCELVSFSPLADEWPDGLDGVYLGGGYPEEYAGELAESGRVRRGVAEAVDRGTPVLAECGGMMWLGEWLETVDGDRHEMVGALPVGTTMTERPTLGYVEVEATGAAPFFPTGGVARGHVFHHAEYEDGADGRSAPFELEARGRPAEPGGWVVERTVASWVHLYFGSRPGFARSFVEACRNAEGGE